MRTALRAQLRSVRRELPDSPALIWRGREISYGELGGMVDEQRRRITEQTTGDEPLGLLAQTSPEAIALMLACVEERRPFVLPSAELPGAVLETLFAKAGCRYRVTPDGGAQALPTLEPDPSASHVPLGPDTVFMLTTSGSTGVPKVVPIRATALVRFTEWARKRFAMGRETGVFNYAPLNFDLCLLDLWTTLSVGGRVTLVERTSAGNARHLLSLMTETRPNLVQAVPMFYRLIAQVWRDTGEQPLTSVRSVLWSGDSMPPSLLRTLATVFPSAHFYNVYGCTEINNAFVNELAPSALPSGQIPLGEALPGVRSLIVDGRGDLIDGPGKGELWVSTPFQTSGYLAGEGGERFGPHHMDEDGPVYFRSGDLVRRHPNGNLTLEGRIDFQVKVRGVQVDTEAVERVLQDQEGVVEAGVVALPEERNGHRLCASVRIQPEARINGLVLRKLCAEHLPPAAVPSSFEVERSSLPRTSTGKLDRKVLKERWSSRV
ncbi:MAG TPA: AMP-binding protein [Candidatus Nocardiopsis merdipullorum]|nr:AMP-binding protein [Candidatus Nocardiopsis merdipullorum]